MGRKSILNDPTYTKIIKNIASNVDTPKKIKERICPDTTPENVYNKIRKLKDLNFISLKERKRGRGVSNSIYKINYEGILDFILNHLTSPGIKFKDNIIFFLHNYLTNPKIPYNISLNKLFEGFIIGIAIRQLLFNYENIALDPDFTKFQGLCIGYFTKKVINKEVYLSGEIMNNLMKQIKHNRYGRDILEKRYYILKKGI